MTKFDIIDTILAAMPATRRQIEIRAGLPKTTVLRRVAQLHKAGWCHIGGWQGDHGSKFQPRFAAGQGADRPCKLKPLTPDEMQRRYREKARKTGAWELRLARLRAGYWAGRAVAEPKGWAAALFTAPRAKEAGRA